MIVQEGKTYDCLTSAWKPVLDSVQLYDENGQRIWLEGSADWAYVKRMHYDDRKLAMRYIEIFSDGEYPRFVLPKGISKGWVLFYINRTPVFTDEKGNEIDID